MPSSKTPAENRVIFKELRMNINGFIQRMRADKKSQPTIKRNIKLTKTFEKYLKEAENTVALAKYLKKYVEY